MIKVLPSHIANLIAAGEVVQRPSSVVKELMENAVDANASQVLLIVNDSGRTLIQVLDNGTGMTKEEAEICFERHATSKIEKVDDLYSINTFGFRGEALASIAACADVTLKTRKAGEETGTEVHIAENNIISSVQTSCPQGCNIAVRNIFYNIPARRKFLKSDNVEYRQIVSEFIKVALSRTDVEFKFIHNSKDIYSLPPVLNLKQRITQIAGKEIAKDLIDIQTDTTVVCVRGFVGRPSLAKKSQPNQYFFVNGRFFKSPLLHKAVMKAYSNLIPDGTIPSYFIFLHIEPENMDVNIHPSKTEIKFENETVIFEILNAAVKEAIGEGAFIPSIDFDTEGVPEIPAVPHNTRYVAPPKINFDPLFNPFKEELKSRRNADFAQNDFESYTPEPKSYFKEQNSYGGVFSEETIGERPIILLKGKYIVTTVKSGLLLIDIARAKERILYERYLDSITETGVAIQENLFPQTIDLDHSSYTILMEDQQRLKEIGFDIRPFGTDCVVVYGLPATLAQEQLDIKECVDTLIHDLTETGKDFGAEFREKVAIDMARSGIRKGLHEINNAEAQHIIDALFACKDPDHAPSGGKCMSIITVEDLAKRL
ncbi:MAG: DNA mismatch repair endonuclease MutL [Bacteroidales bacterium]|nr:DNA mismatch repair endonuclease MutL [Bacteroidales bacterium]